MGIWPALLPTILTFIAMSTATLTQPTITVQTVNVTLTSGTIVADPMQWIKNAINKALQRNPGSGPGGLGGPRAPGGPAEQPANQQNVVPQVADVHLMESLPAIFLDNRAEAEDFINGIQAYICLNQEVPGFTLPMKKIALTLTLI